MAESDYVLRIPLATYRLQFNKNFTFSDARDVLGYLADLGITEVYASSYLKSRRGSLHGYDIVDFSRINDEIGSAEEYEAFAAEQKRLGLGQVFDVVPNHMCVASPGNIWWRDVLENGPSSIYARFFDINWHPLKRELTNKILVPVLGDQYGHILESQELQLNYGNGEFFISYWDLRFPLRPDTYVAVLSQGIKELEGALTPENPHYIELLSINTALSHLPAYTETDPERMTERNREKEIAKKRLAVLCARSPEVCRFIDENVKLFNGVKGVPQSFDLLDELLQNQAFRLSYWRVATEEINYRRFFDINELAAIRVEDPLVFNKTHEFVFRMIREGKTTGLRVDHPDGLYNPSQYFRELQRNCYVQTRLNIRETAEGRRVDRDEEMALSEALGRRYDDWISSDPGAKAFYIVGEKILMPNEPIPNEWPIFSTTGYTFCNLVNGIFVDASAAAAFDRIYRWFAGVREGYDQVRYEKKKLMMMRAMSSEIYTLGYYLNRISEKNRQTRDFTLNSLTVAIVEVIASFPVYRTYINNWNVPDRDREHIELAVGRAKERNPGVSESVFDFLEDVLLLRSRADLNEEERAERLEFVMRFQQITGPVMAKGLEDTAFYVYNRLISLNEVGGSPDRFGTSVEEFHKHNARRQKSWPHAMIATSTHDSKRGEDVRARIDVLSEMPEEWRKQLVAWSRTNRGKCRSIDGSRAPSPNEEYFLYQTLVGTWPIGGRLAPDYDAFVRRIGQYMLKALREAKATTSWVNPRVAHEQAVDAFVEAVLNRNEENEFLDSFEEFHAKIAYCGMCNSLSQALLKIASPGLPDFYQGTELWTFSLVDPDNRRPVDYTERKKMLYDLMWWEKEAAGRDIARRLWDAWEDGRIKMYVVYKALHVRKDLQQIVSRMRYTPLRATGPRAENVCAFLRREQNEAFVVAVPRLLMRLLNGEGRPFPKEGVWDDSRLHLPAMSASVFQNVFTGEKVRKRQGPEGDELPCADLFQTFPVALLRALKES